MTGAVFVDSDVILDVLAVRQPHYAYAAALLDLGYGKKLDLCTNPVVLANVFYILRKKYGIEKSKELLKTLRTVVGVLPMDEKMVDDSLNSKFGDFEDGLQYFSAKRNGIPVIVTRNTKDYREKDVLAQTAEDYIKTNVQPLHA